jgi:hypothetical protein
MKLDNVEPLPNLQGTKAALALPPVPNSLHFDYTEVQTLFTLELTICMKRKIRSAIRILLNLLSAA